LIRSKIKQINLVKRLLCYNDDRKNKATYIPQSTKS